MAACELSKVEGELNSSDETLESVSNVSPKPFSDIASVQLVKRKLLMSISNERKYYIVTRTCLLPDGHVVAVFRESVHETITWGDTWHLKLLDSDMKTKLVFDINNKLDSARLKPTSVDMAVFDRKRVAVAMTGSLIEQKGMAEEPVSSIHLITVYPSVEISPEIKLKYKTEKINCFNNKMYCYSPNLKRSRFMPCPGIEILSINGELLKSIQLFDTVSCFCPTKDGDIVYFGSRNMDNNYSQKVYRCVSRDNIEIFSQLRSELPEYDACISDIEGNIIVSHSGNIVLLNPDGSQNRVLLANNNMEVTDEDMTEFGLTTRDAIVRQQTSFCFSDDYATLLVTGCFQYNTPHGEYSLKQKIYVHKFRYSK